MMQVELHVYMTWLSAVCFAIRYSCKPPPTDVRRESFSSAVFIRKRCSSVYSYNLLKFNVQVTKSCSTVGSKHKYIGVYYGSTKFSLNVEPATAIAIDVNVLGLQLTRLPCTCNYFYRRGKSRNGIIRPI